MPLESNTQSTLVPQQQGQRRGPGRVSASGLTRHDEAGGFEICATAFWTMVVIIFFPALACCFTMVNEFERAVIYRLGRIRSGGARGPGIFFILPCIDTCKVIDLRTRTFDIPPQVILTKDSVSVTVDAVMYYKVYNPILAVANIGDFDKSSQLLAASTLRNALGTRVLQQLLSDREQVAEEMKADLDEATDPWGVKVERVEIKNVALPRHLQTAMAAEAQAQREANAKFIAAEGEMQASKALKDASQVMTGSPGALQLRYLQTLNNLSAGSANKIYFPVPMEMLSAFNKR